MNDTRPCRRPHTRSALSDITPGCCVKPPRGTRNQMITSSDGWTDFNACIPSFFFFFCWKIKSFIGHICNGKDYLCLTKWICPKTMTIWLMRMICICIVFSLTVTTMSSEVSNYLLSLWRFIHAALTKAPLFIWRDSNKCRRIGGGYLFILDPSDSSGRETMEARGTKWIPLCRVLSPAINIIWLVTW